MSEKIDYLVAIVLRNVDKSSPLYQDNNAIMQLREEISDILYVVDSRKYPVRDVYKELNDAGLIPPKLKRCPCCGHPAKYAISQARFLKPELVNLYLVVGCPNCGLTNQMFKIGNDLLGACETAADKWNRRSRNG